MLQSYFFLSLHKIGCTRQFVSELTLRSFALSLQSKALLKAEIGSGKADTYIKDVYCKNMSHE